MTKKQITVRTIGWVAAIFLTGPWGPSAQVTAFSFLVQILAVGDMVRLLKRQGLTKGFFQGRALSNAMLEIAYLVLVGVLFPFTMGYAASARVAGPGTRSLAVGLLITAACLVGLSGLILGSREAPGRAPAGS